MSECTCPEDGRMVNRDDRVYLYEPGADVISVMPNGQQHRHLDASKVHIFHKECPQHGYKDVTDE